MPAAPQRRRVEITGPVEAKMIINAFNSGADSYMTDFEDSNSPNWENQIQGPDQNLYKAIRRELSFTNEAGKEYKLNDKIATLQIRPRGWHLDEKHVTVDGQRVSGGIFDFGLVFFHNAKEQIARGAGPLLLPAEDGKPPGSPPVERHLRHGPGPHRPAPGHDQGHGAGRNHPRHLRDGRNPLRTAQPLRRPQCRPLGLHLLLHQEIQEEQGLLPGPARRHHHGSALHARATRWPWCQACHKRGAPAMGGMSALIPIKNDPVANEKALAGIRHDKTRDANDGFDGGWVAHPGLVPIAMEEFVKVLGDKPNQFEKQVEGSSVRSG